VSVRLPVGAETTIARQPDAHGQLLRRAAGMVQRPPKSAGAATDKARPVLLIDGRMPGAQRRFVAVVDRARTEQFITPPIPLLATSNRR